jgi:hypothetical protein
MTEKYILTKTFRIKMSYMKLHYSQGGEDKSWK